MSKILNMGLYTHRTARASLQMANVQCVKLQDESFDWLVGLVFFLGWTEVKAPFTHFQKFSTKVKDKTFGGRFFHHRI
jgi:hypothetical protein